MTRQEIIYYAKSELAKVPGARFITADAPVNQDALVMLIGFSDRPGAVSASISGMEMMQNYTDSSIRSLVYNRIDAALARYQREVA